MFKKYNLVDELSAPDDEKPCQSDSLNNLIETKDWKPEEDRFYELELFGIMPEKDEDRVFT